MSSAPTAQPSAFQLRVPESWLEFDIWRATRTGDLARMVDARIAETPQLRRYRGALLKALRQAAEEAERSGALYCAAMSEMVEDSGMLAAIGMVFKTDGAPEPADNTAETIAGQVSAVAQREGTAEWRRVEVVEIPAGRAVRVYGIDAVDFGSQTVDCVVMQTLIPFPDGSAVLNIALTSPQVELTEPMLDLFDAISSTLSWTFAENGADSQPSE
jgi:hypothetical protein